MLTDSSRTHVEAKETESSQEEQPSNPRIARRDSATGASLTKRSRIRGGRRGIIQKGGGICLKLRNYVGDVEVEEKVRVLPRLGWYSGRLS